MRIGGLASGIDTETIVKDLMKAERIPLDKLTQKKQYFEWQLNDYRTANRNLKDYSTKLFDNQILSKNFTAKNVTVSEPNAVSIRSKGNSEDFSGTIKVNQLATNATLKGDKLAENTSVKDLIGSGGAILIKAPGDKTPSTENGGYLKVVLTGDEKSFEEIAKRITEQSGVRAFYDSESGRFGISAKESGGYTIGSGSIDSADPVANPEAFIDIKDFEGGDLTTKLGLNVTNINKVAGANAELSYNGMDIIRSSNSFDLDGMEITLKEVTGKQVTFNATTDTEKVFENIKGFVDDYNKLIEDLNKKIREPVNRSFQPLSAEQKKDMSDKEVELWEEKAMSGTLRNDPELKTMLTKLRNIMTQPIELENGEKISLSDIGITTSKNYLDNGKLVIDEKKLKEAISQNPQGVEKLFNNDGKTAKDTGIARQLRAEVDATQKNIQKSAGKLGDTNKAFSLGRTLDNMNKQIERFETRLQMSETRYWKQFNAMENAIQRANAQSASLMSSLGGGM